MKGTNALIEKAYFHGKFPDPGNLYPDGKEAVDVDDIEMLEDLIIVALNDGYEKADQMNKEKLGNTGGLI